MPFAVLVHRIAQAGRPFHLQALARGELILNGDLHTLREAGVAGAARTVVIGLAAQCRVVFAAILVDPDPVAFVVIDLVAVGVGQRWRPKLVLAAGHQQAIRSMVSTSRRPNALSTRRLVCLSCLGAWQRASLLQSLPVLQGSPLSEQTLAALIP